MSQPDPLPLPQTADARGLLDFPLADPMSDRCWAGHKAFFGGKWTTPCQLPWVHKILSAPGAPEVVLCDGHFKEVNDAGLITMPYVSDDEQEARRIVHEQLAKGG